jgi:hypothetical protein
MLRGICSATDGTIFPPQDIPFGAAFVRQAGNFWTHPHIHTIFQKTERLVLFDSFLKLPGFGMLACSSCSLKGKGGLCCHNVYAQMWQ